MNRNHNFRIGSSPVVRTRANVDAILVTVRKDDTIKTTLPSDGGSIPAIEIGPLSPEEAYQLGCALLAAARINGVGG